MIYILNFIKISIPKATNRYFFSSVALFAISTFTMPVLANEDTYQIEFNASSANSDNDNKLNTTVNSLGFNYFISPVALDKDQPFGEAEFLQRSSNLYTSSGSLTYEDKYFEKTRYGSYSFGGRVYFGDWYITGGTSSRDLTLRIKSNNSHSYAITDGSNSLGVGFYFLPLSTLTYTRSEGAISQSPSQGLSSVAEIKDVRDTLSLKTLLNLQNNQTLVLNGSWAQDNREQTLKEVNKIVDIRGQYYPNPKTYFLVGYLQNSGDRTSSEGNQISYGVGFTTNHRLLFNVMATKFSAKNSGVGYDESSFRASVDYRF